MNTRAPPSLPEVQGPFPLHHLCILARCAGGAACSAGGAGAVCQGRHAPCPLAAQGAADLIKMYHIKNIEIWGYISFVGIKFNSIVQSVLIDINI